MTVVLTGDSKITYVSFDPGETTGWVTWDSEGNMIGKGQANREQIINILDVLETCQNLTHVIYEDYRIFSHKAKAHIGSRVETAQVIGLIDRLIRKMSLGSARQPSSILPIAQKWTQVKMPSDHSQGHWVSAFNHGAYYLINAGIRKSELERQMEK